ncbi:anthranilate phosphoribosyltransferase [Hamadaea tsunoensis]|uniref:anthranilate phosphoribosyltransferase n=1 Tax=Hamadaea tsunoensis TaxID=53368 RepID=UPI00040B0E63|nr:anthranilate phosphoribosyltransferase [Hamadaea tsunoensis]
MNTLARLLAREDLSREQAAAAMTEIVLGAADPVRIAGFLVALRAKGETAVEIAGLVDALLQAAVRVPVPGPTVDIAGTGGDGTNAVNISTMAAVVVAATGRTVVKHGGRAASAGSAGSADLVEALGVPLDLTPEQHVRVAREAGITFLFAAALHPGMRHAGPVRRALGVPTVFNALGPLINPAEPTHRLIGVADPRLLPAIVETLRVRGADALVVRGGDGLDKLSTAAPSHLWRVRDGAATASVLDPAELGIPRPDGDGLRGGSAADNVRVVHDLVAGRPGPVRDAVLLNAAGAVLVARGAAPEPDGFRAALKICAEAVDTGRAAATLSRWIEASNRNFPLP